MERNEKNKKEEGNIPSLKKYLLFFQTRQETKQNSK